MHLGFLFLLVIKVCRLLVRRMIPVVLFQERRIKTQKDKSWIPYLRKFHIVMVNIPNAASGLPLADTFTTVTWSFCFIHLLVPVVSSLSLPIGVFLISWDLSLSLKMSKQICCLVCHVCVVTGVWQGDNFYEEILFELQCSIDSYVHLCHTVLTPALKHLFHLWIAYSKQVTSFCDGSDYADIPTQFCFFPSTQYYHLTSPGQRVT